MNRQEEVDRFNETKKRQELDHAKLMRLYDGIAHVEEELGPYFKRLSVNGYRTNGSITFEDVPTKEEVIRLYKLFPPVFPAIKYSDSCTSFVTEASLSAKEQARVHDGEATIEIIHPFHARLQHCYMAGSPWTLEFSWVTELPSGDSLVVHVEGKWAHWRNAVSVKQNKREVGRDGYKKVYEVLWEMTHNFSGPSRFVKWYASDRAIMNDFTIYFLDVTEELEHIMAPVENT